MTNLQQPESTAHSGVLRLADIDLASIRQLFATQGLSISDVAPGCEIPGSHWGDDEAGLISDQIFARADTPVHSLMHEACHYFLMDEKRRQVLHTDAGGSSVEENAVCYLQICLAATLAEVGAERMMQDMDAWGYSFRLGSTRAWFEQDAEDAIELLESRGLWQQYNLADCQRKVCSYRIIDEAAAD